MSKKKKANKNKEEIKDINEDTVENQQEEDEVKKKKKMKEDLNEKIDDNAIEELVLLKQSLEEKNEKIEELETKVKELNEVSVRVKADFENYRRRLRKEQEDFNKYANQKLIEDLLPILDNFDRALVSGLQNKDFDTFYEGVKLIEKSFYDVLEKKYNLKSVGEPKEEFNPEYHEALTIIEDAEVNGLKVDEVFQKGYVLADRIIRHAKVVVRKGVKKKEEKKEEKQEEDAK